MSGSVPAQKTCMICKQDVSAKPRVKDAQGRYLCVGDCQKKYQAQVPPTAPVSVIRSASAEASSVPMAPAKAAGSRASRETDLDNGLMNNLISDSPMMTAKRCESCGNPLTNNAVVCMSCGYNTATGKTMKTRVSVEKVKEEKKKGGYSNPYSTKHGYAPWIACGVLALIAVIMGFTPLMDKGLAMGGLIGLGLLGLAGSITTSIAVYMEGEPTMIGLLWLLRGGQRYVHKVGDSGLWLMLGIEVALLAYVVFFVDNVWAKCLMTASFIGWFCFGISMGISGLTIPQLLMH